MKRDFPLFFALALIAAALWFNVIAARQCSAVYGFPESPEQQSDTSDNGAKTKLAASARPNPADDLYEKPSKNGCFRGPFGIPADGWVAFFTLVLTAATFALWHVTRQTLIHAQESSERQLRAYVLLQGGNVYDASKIGLNSIQPTIKVLPEWTNFVGMDMTIKNSGQTPAKHVRHWAELAISSAAEEHTLVPPAVLSDQQASVIGPGITITKILMMRPFPLAEPILTELRNGDKGIYLYGKIIYQDWFGRERKTIYRLRYSGPWPPMPSGTLIFSLAGNDAD